MVGIQISDARMTQDGLRQAASIFSSLQARRYILAVGPPRSEIWPVKAGDVWRMASISPNDGIFGTALNDAPFMFGDRAEGAAAKTAAHDVDRMLNHFKSRHVRIAVFLVRHARIGQVKNAIHFLGGQRNRRRINARPANRAVELTAVHCPDWFHRA